MYRRTPNRATGLSLSRGTTRPDVSVQLSPARRKQIRVEKKLAEHRRRRLGAALRRHAVRQQARYSSEHANLGEWRGEDNESNDEGGDREKWSGKEDQKDEEGQIHHHTKGQLNLTEVLKRTRQLRLGWHLYSEPSASKQRPEATSVVDLPHVPSLTEEVERVVDLTRVTRAQRATLEAYKANLCSVDEVIEPARHDEEDASGPLGGTQVLRTKLRLQAASQRAQRLAELEEMLSTLEQNAKQIIASIKETHREIERLRATRRIPSWKEIPKDLLMRSFQQASYYVLRKHENRRREFSIAQLVDLIAKDTSAEVCWLRQAFSSEYSNGKWEDLLRKIVSAMYAEERRIRKEGLPISASASRGYRIRRLQREYYIQFDDKAGN